MLSLMYYHGHGVEQNYETAFEWIQDTSPYFINRKARFTLGMMYYYGHGTKKNDVRAFSNIGSAAKSGHAQAQYQKALMYLEGIGTKADTEKAYFWISIAADNGYEDAIEKKAEIAEELSQEQRNKIDVRAKWWLQRYKKNAALFAHHDFY